MWTHPNVGKEVIIVEKKRKNKWSLSDEWRTLPRFKRQKEGKKPLRI